MDESHGSAAPGRCQRQFMANMAEQGELHLICTRKTPDSNSDMKLHSSRK